MEKSSRSLLSPSCLLQNSLSQLKMSTFSEKHKLSFTLFTYTKKREVFIELYLRQLWQPEPWRQNCSRSRRCPVTPDPDPDCFLLPGYPGGHWCVSQAQGACGKRLSFFRPRVAHISFLELPESGFALDACTDIKTKERFVLGRVEEASESKYCLWSSQRLIMESIHLIWIKGKLRFLHSDSADLAQWGHELLPLLCVLITAKPQQHPCPHEFLSGSW